MIMTTINISDDTRTIMATVILILKEAYKTGNSVLTLMSSCLPEARCDIMGDVARDIMVQSNSFRFVVGNSQTIRFPAQGLGP